MIAIIVFGSLNLPKTNESYCSINPRGNKRRGLPMIQLRKFIVRDILVLAAPLLVTGAPVANSVLHTALKGDVLKVGTTGDWNPMTMRDAATIK